MCPKGQPHPLLHCPLSHLSPEGRPGQEGARGRAGGTDFLVLIRKQRGMVVVSYGIIETEYCEFGAGV